MEPMCIQHLLKLVLTVIFCTLISCTHSNQPPKIVIGLPYSPIKDLLTLSEDTPLHSYLAILEAKDDDSGPDGDVECQTDNLFINLLLVYPQTYKVELVKELDREALDDFHVGIVCRDNGVPAMTATDGFTVKVVDINDNPPVFQNFSYNVSVTEGVEVNTFVVKVMATDSDSDLNGLVRYTFYNDSLYNSSSFIIEEDTGEIRTKAEMDREKVGHYVLTVVATDSGTPAISSTAEVNIVLLDVNDQAPVVTTTEIHVKENQKSMEVVGRLAASDLDMGKNAQVVFSKIDNSTSSSTTPFLLQADGEILSVVSLDREQRSHYVVEVEVKDLGIPRRSSTAAITIIVDDMNDHIPVITSRCMYDRNDNRYDDGADVDNSSLTDNKGNQGSVIIDWYLPDNKKVIYQVTAEDADLGENAEIIFSIEPPTSDNSSHTPARDGLFSINSSTGEIFLARPVRQTDQLQQLLKIRVADKGIPSLSTFCVLNIIINVDLQQLATSTAKPAVKRKSHRRSRKYRNSTSDVRLAGVQYLSGRLLGVIYCLLSSLVVNHMSST